MLLFFILIVFGFNFFDKSRSVSAHLVGLVNGFSSSLDNIFLGNGSGSAGSIVTNTNIFRELNPNLIFLKVGNESTFGILFYQFGLVLPILLLLYFIKLSFYFYGKSEYQISGLIIGYIFYMLFSESFLTIPNQVFFYMLLNYRYRLLNTRDSY